MQYGDLTIKKTSAVLAVAVFIALATYFSIPLQENISSNVGTLLISFKESALYYRYDIKLAYKNEGFLAAVMPVFRSTPVPYTPIAKSAQSVPVLLYHGLIVEPDGENITQSNFEAQMFALKAAGWQTIGIEDFYAFVRGERQVPDKSFVLTFDDGAKTSYYPVDPILRALGYKAVTYIIGGHSLHEDRNSNYYLTVDELRAMQKSGRWDIQAHAQDGHVFQPISVSGDEGHFYTNKLWISDKGRLETNEEYKVRIGGDLQAIDNKLKEVLDINSTSFAFPYGDFAQNKTNYFNAKSVYLNAVHSNFDIAFFQTWPSAGFTQNFPESKPFLVKRIDVGGYWTADDLLGAMNYGRPKFLPYYAGLHPEDGWIKEWGDLVFSDNQLLISSLSGLNGGTIFLDGTYGWTDYAFEAAIDWVRGETASLMARHKDSYNFVSCSFSNRYMNIDEYVNGERKRLTSAPIKTTLSWDNARVGVQVRGKHVECLIDGRVVASSDDMNPALKNGGIGFKTWDPKPDNSSIIVREVKVTSLAQTAYAQ